MKSRILIGGILLSIGHLLLNFTVFQQTLLLLLGVFIIGIPHGSIDHYLYMVNTQVKINAKYLIKFLIQYIGVGLIYAFFWWLNPVLALLIFIGISAYHFGELDTLNFDFRNKKYAFIVAFSYGLIFLLNLLLVHFKDVLPIIQSFPGITLLAGAELLKISNSLLPVFPILSGMLFFFILFISLQKGSYFSRTTVMNLLQLVALQVIVFSMPLLLGFAFYFCAWHSLLSFKIILHHLSWQTKSSVFVLKKLIPTNILSWLFLGILLIYFRSDLNTLLAVLFLGIAILTAPHIGVISKMLHAQKMKA
jgi:Brp/Blh family beta-carotene 15,15'-monooxygenase